MEGLTSNNTGTPTPLETGGPDSNVVPDGIDNAEMVDILRPRRPQGDYSMMRPTETYTLNNITQPIPNIRKFKDTLAEGILVRIGQGQEEDTTLRAQQIAKGLFRIHPKDLSEIIIAENTPLRERGEALGQLTSRQRSLVNPDNLAAYIRLALSEAKYLQDKYKTTPNASDLLTHVLYWQTQGDYIGRLNSKLARLLLDSPNYVEDCFAKDMDSAQPGFPDTLDLVIKNTNAINLLSDYCKINNIAFDIQQLNRIVRGEYDGNRGEEEGIVSAWKGVINKFGNKPVKYQNNANLFDLATALITNDQEALSRIFATELMDHLRFMASIRELPVTEQQKFIQSNWQTNSFSRFNTIVNACKASRKATDQLILDAQREAARIGYPESHSDHQDTVNYIVSEKQTEFLVSALGRKPKETEQRLFNFTLMNMSDLNIDPLNMYENFLISPKVDV